MKKPTLLPLLRLCGAAVFSLTFAACSGVASPPAVPAAPATPATPAMPTAPTKAPAPVAISTLMQQIQAEIGDASCDSTQQCKTVAIGHKACGGPESYLVWSSKTGNGNKITSLAKAYAAERKGQTIKSGMMSTCSVVVDPGATCNAGYCVAGQAGLSAPVAR
jgi:hypothetical protein